MHHAWFMLSYEFAANYTVRHESDKLGYDIKFDPVCGLYGDTF